MKQFVAMISEIMVYGVRKIGRGIIASLATLDVAWCNLNYMLNAVKVVFSHLGFSFHPSLLRMVEDGTAQGINSAISLVMRIPWLLARLQGEVSRGIARQ